SLASPRAGIFLSTVTHIPSPTDSLPQRRILPMATPSPTLTSDYENPPEPLGEFIVHLCMPKTATTMLQTHLFPNHSQIAYQGKHAGGKRLQYRDEIVS